MLRMSAGSLLLRLETRATEAEKMLALLRTQVGELTRAAETNSFQGQVEAIKRENEQLRRDIQKQKEKLIRAERDNGVMQVMEDQKGEKEDFFLHQY